MNKTNGNFYALLTVISEHQEELKGYIPQVFDIIIKKKAFIQEVEYLRKQAIVNTDDPEIIKKKEEYESIKTRISVLQASKEYDHNYNQKYRELEQELIRLEAELIQYLPKLQLEKKFSEITNEVVRNKIPQDTTLIEYIWFRPYDFKNNKYTSPKYLAFILEKDKNDIQMVDLGDAGDIDIKIQQYINGLDDDLRGNNKGEIPKEVDLQENIQKSFDDDKVELAKQLFNLIVNPVLSQVKSRSNKLIVSTSGNISQLPFQIIVQPNNRFMIHDYDIQYIDTSRDLVRFEIGSREKYDKKAVIIVDPNYDYKEDTINSESEYSTGTGIVKSHSNTAKGGEIRILKRLRDTEREGNGIKELIKDNTLLFSWNDSINTKMKSVESPYILHISTHGAFETDNTDNSNFDKDNPPVKSDPLLFSKLALSGWNTYQRNAAEGNLKDMINAKYGGINASEVMDMYLYGNNLTVLSSCGSGKGEVLYGDGLYGLRRSFIVAGSKSVVISLFSVLEKETTDFMIKYYQSLIDDADSSKPAILKNCQLEEISNLEAKYKSDCSNSHGLMSPNLWGGAFVYVGEPDGKINILHD
jgi:CHAT domain-containing protein